MLSEGGVVGKREANVGILDSGDGFGFKVGFCKGL
jgi:hypothetical protein